MGTDAAVLVYAIEPEALVAWAIGEVERLEQCWSRFRVTSELNALNRTAGRAAVVVSPTLALALERARDAHAMTDGRFDPTVLPALCRLGYDRTFGEVPAHGDACTTAPEPVAGFDTVTIERAGAANAPVVRVTLPHGVALDLGGIGKGLAVDVVTDGLVARRAGSVCVSLGGDVRVAGPGPDEDGSWSIAIEDPRTDAVRFRFPLVDEAIAQSTTLLRRWARGGRELHHIVDPSRGDCAQSDVESAVVTARSAWRADVLAKAAIVAGAHDGLALLERSGVDGWLFGRDGTTRSTPAVRLAEVTSP